MAQLSEQRSDRQVTGNDICTPDGGRDSMTTAERLTAAVQILEPLPRASSWCAELLALRQRLAQQTRCIAMFGAFSAGKSSLLNAMLGEPVLTVSPNPTTAAVTELYAVDAHMTAASDSITIHAKSADELWQDVRQACQEVRHPVTDLAAAVAFAASLHVGDVPAAARRAANFLVSLAAGWSEMKDRLGSSWQAGLSDLAGWSADERRACFLRQIDVSREAPVLQSGVMLVDTPGVDSVHRRHTDTAFSYMRKADAILFVLYYTHAFSRADKDFLLQLAGVQDVAGTDKLFVVINAVDLASDAGERAAVRDRVVTELRAVGLRQPRVFEVSSQLALAAKMLRRQETDTRFQQIARQRLGLSAVAPLPPLAEMLAQSGVPALVDELLAWTATQTVSGAAAAADRLLRHTARSVHAERLQREAQQQTDAVADSRWRAALATLQSEWLQSRSQDVTNSAWVRTLGTQWDELTYHTVTRIQLRFPELFREAFHPGRFRQRQAPAIGLSEAAAELTASLARQTDGECRTLALRLQKQSLQALGEEVERLQTQVDQVAPGYAAIAAPHWEWPDLSATVDAFEIDPLWAQSLFHHFKSAQQFFEAGGQAAMRDEAAAVVSELVRQRVAQVATQLRERALTALAQSHQDLLRMAASALDTGQTIGDPSGLPAWRQADERLAALCE